MLSQSALQVDYLSQQICQIIVFDLGIFNYNTIMFVCLYGSRIVLVSGYVSVASSISNINICKKYILHKVVCYLYEKGNPDWFLVKPVIFVGKNLPPAHLGVPPSYSTIHKAAGLTIPGRSMICLVLFHCSTIPTVKLSMGEQPLGVVPTGGFFWEPLVTKEPAALWIALIHMTGSLPLVLLTFVWHYPVTLIYLIDRHTPNSVVEDVCTFHMIG